MNKYYLALLSGIFRANAPDIDLLDSLHVNVPNIDDWFPSR